MTNKIIYITFIIPMLLTILIHIYGFDKAKADFDQFKQYDDMRYFYDNKIFPTVGTKTWDASIDSTPRMPGGFFYIVYTNLYKLSGENLNLARLYFMFLTAIILFAFLFWFYKRFGKNITAVFFALIICNAYLFFNNIDIYNPNLVIFLSFILLMLFCEYVADGRYSFISALLMFPLLALMAQCHFAIFFSMVPTLIVYHIIKFKSLTRKYIIPLVLSVFISFLFYLPYLIDEIQNGFANTLSMISFRDGGKLVGLPQIYCMLIYPTTEMSIFYGRTNAILYFWFKNNYAFIFEGFILILSALFSIYSLFFSIKNKIFSKVSENNITDIMLKESLILYLIYIPTTLLIFFIAKSKPGTFHYIYNAFALSFVPIIILIKYIFDNKSVKYKNILSIFAVLISVSFSLQIVRTINLYTHPYNYENHKKLLYSIIEDSNGEKFKIETIQRRQYLVNYMYRLASSMYNESDRWNSDDNAKLTYFIYDKDWYFFEGKWSDVKDGKNKPIPENAIKIWGDDNLAIYKYIKD